MTAKDALQKVKNSTHEDARLEQELLVGASLHLFWLQCTERRFRSGKDHDKSSPSFSELGLEEKDWYHRQAEPEMQLDQVSIRKSQAKQSNGEFLKHQFRTYELFPD